MSITAPRRRTALFALAASSTVVALTTALTSPVPAAATGSANPTIVLVHGAFADASGWNDVTTGLQSAGYTVLAPANPLRGVDADSAYLRSVLDTVDGPVVVVGHSYGGFVLTNAATDDPDVTALVYVAGFAPAAGDTVGDLTAMNPGSGLGDPANLVVRPHPGGADGYINPTTFHEIFAADLPADVAAVMAASQRPADVATLTQPSGAPAWESIPSWFVVATEDNTIPPATQRFMAERAGSTVVEVTSSHVVMMSHPDEVVAVIEDAAASAG